MSWRGGHEGQIRMPLFGRVRVGFASIDNLQHLRMVRHFGLPEVGGTTYFASAVGEDSLCLRLQKLPSKYQHTVIKKSLADRRKDALVKGLVEVDTSYLGADHVGKSFDGDRYAHIYPLGQAVGANAWVMRALALKT